MGLALSLLATGSALAQVTADTVRALNTARDTAVNLNGGLSAYQPAACMFQTGEGGGDCLVRADHQGFLFQFLGGVPGWQEENIAPSVQTRVLISPDGRSVVRVDYNGAPR
jgi:hypothetical protein